MKRDKSKTKSTNATTQKSELPLSKVINNSFRLTGIISCIICLLSILSAVILIGEIIKFKNGPYNLTQSVSKTQYLMKEMESDVYHEIVQLTASRLQNDTDDTTILVNELNSELQNLYSLVEKYNSSDAGILTELQNKINESNPHRIKIYEFVENHRMTNANDILVKNYLPLVEEINGLLDTIATDSDTYANNQITKTVIFSLLIGIIILAMIIISYFASRKYAKKTSSMIVSPITEVKEVMNELAKGNLQVSVKSSSIVELNELSNATKKTINTLESYIHNITTVLKQLENRDMTVTVDIDYIGDFSPIKNSLIEITQYLNQLILSIKNSAGQVASGAEQISSSSRSIAEGAQEQNNSITTLVDQVNNITTVVRNNANKAKDVSKISTDSLEVVEQGNIYMDALLEAMKQITDQSNQISKIIEVIDDIASQTNLLSLNASIEAARAGEQGKGFAVVADQIGKLANDCSKAAGNTTSLIHQSLEAVNHGSALADETAKLLHDIVTSSSKTSDLVNDITTACETQAEQLNSVLASIQEISVIVESNSAFSEESSAASQEFLSQSETLRELLEGFQL